MYVFWPAVAIFTIGTAIGLTQEWILWRRDRRQESEHIRMIADAYIRSLRKGDDE